MVNSVRNFLKDTFYRRKDKYASDQYDFIPLNSLSDTSDPGKITFILKKNSY